jgi:hypothetical protein
LDETHSQRHRDEPGLTLLTWQQKEVYHTRNMEQGSSGRSPGSQEAQLGRDRKAGEESNGGELTKMLSTLLKSMESIGNRLETLERRHLGEKESEASPTKLERGGRTEDLGMTTPEVYMENLGARTLEKVERRNPRRVTVTKLLEQEESDDSDELNEEEIWRGGIPTNLPHFRAHGSLELGETAYEFMENFETICFGHQIPKYHWTRMLTLCLGPVERAWLERTVEGNMSWKQVREQFLKHFEHPNEKMFLREKLQALKQTISVRQYADEFMRLIHRLKMKGDSEEAIYTFKRGLRRNMLEYITTAENSLMITNEVQSKALTISVEMLVKIAINAEANDTLMRSTSDLSGKRGERTSTFTQGRDQCKYCGRNGHRATECRQRLGRLSGFGMATTSQGSAGPNEPGSVAGVISRTQGQPSQTPRKPDLKAARIRCYKCNELGHYANECRGSSKSREQAPTAKRVQSEDIPQVVNLRSGGSILTPCLINGRSVMALVDGGADISFISSKIVTELDLTITPVIGKIKQFANKSELDRIGYVDKVTLENGSRKLLVRLEVAEMSGEEDLLIGTDLWRPLGYELLGVPCTLPTVPEDTKSSQPMDINGKIKEKEFTAREIVDEWKQVLTDNQCLPKNSRCQLDGAELSINTADAKPIWIRQYPLVEAYRAKVTDKVQEWLDQGVITVAPKGCQWNLPLIATRKPGKDGQPDGIRVCLDARSLNDIITEIPDSNLPRIREVIDHLGEFQWISVVDLADSYHQFPLKEEDRCKTAFTWKGQQYVFTCVPFGLKIMTGHMQRLMEKLLGTTGRIPFQDDVAIASIDRQTHIKDVLDILKKITYDAGLRLRLEKCKFFQSEARVLGFLLTREGLKMDPGKVRAIVNWPRPSDAKGMRRFLGSVNFNREFSPQFARILAPLDNLRNVKGKIEWSPDNCKAFQAVKELMVSDIQLRSVKWEEVFYLTTDASTSGIGAWLGQKDDKGVIQPIVCASKKLNQTQQRWSASKKELYANMWGMNKFRQYLLGRKFINRVDHKPLVSMLKNKLNLLTEGWIDTIMVYDFDTVYLPGEQNTLADGLSRQGENISEEFNVHKVQSQTGADTEALQIAMEKRGKKIPDIIEQEKLIQDQHALGHFGMETMYRKLWSTGIWWPNMRGDLAKAIETCSACNRFNIIKEGYHPARSVEADLPWDHVQVDLIGPLPKSNQGHGWILTCVDVFTGYVVLRSMKSKSEEDTATALWSIFCEYGLPRIMQSDQGSEFVNKIVGALCEVYGVTHRLITAYHPQANGTVERKNKEVSKVLKKFMVNATAFWHEWLPLTQMSLNLQINKRTGSSPYSLMFARAENQFEDYRWVSVPQEALGSIDALLEQQKLFREVIIPAIADRSRRTKATAHIHLDRKHKIVAPFKVGEHVFALDKTRSSKWDPVYEGPFVVVKQSRGGAYTLADATNNILKRKFTVDMLKPMLVSSGGGIPVLPTNTEQQHYEVEHIVQHKRNRRGENLYLVRWKNYQPEDDSWVKEQDFDDIAIIKKFWLTQPQHQQSGYQQATAGNRGKK